MHSMIWFTSSASKKRRRSPRVASTCRLTCAAARLLFLARPPGSPQERVLPFALVGASTHSASLPRRRSFAAGAATTLLPRRRYVRTRAHAYCAALIERHPRARPPIASLPSPLARRPLPRTGQLERAAPRARGLGGLGARGRGRHGDAERRAAGGRPRLLQGPYI